MSVHQSQERKCCWIKMTSKTVKLRLCSVSGCKETAPKSLHSIPKDLSITNAWLNDQ